MGCNMDGAIEMRHQVEPVLWRLQDTRAVWLINPRVLGRVCGPNSDQRFGCFGCETRISEREESID